MEVLKKKSWKEFRKSGTVYQLVRDICWKCLRRGKYVYLKVTKGPYK
jgi:hypothetical protein